MKLGRPLFIFLASVCLTLIAGCTKRNRGEDKVVELDARTLAIHEAALVSMILHDSPKAPFCIAAEIDDEACVITTYPKASEARVLSAAKPKGRLLPITDIRVPKDGEMENTPSGGRRYVGLTSLSLKTRVNAYMIEKVVERSETTVEVRWMVFCGPLDAHGGTMLLELKDGAWQASHVRNEWVS